MAAATASREQRRDSPSHEAVGGARAADAPRAPPQNQELQSLYAAGTLRARLQVGAADDPAEAQADRVADAVMGGAPCPLCQAGAAPCTSCAAKVRRKARDGGGAGPVHAGTLGLGSGHALGAGERSRFERAFGIDLGRVRVHDDDRAARSADAIQARAFSAGEHVAFGAGEYQPHTPQGQRLLAHELAHLALGHGGVRRQGTGGVCSEAAGVCEAPEQAAGVSRIGDEPATRPHPDGFDPCAVNVRELSNYDLLAELNHTNPVVAAGRDAPRFLDYRNLQRRLHAEMARRVQMGHHWLASNPTTIPAALIQVGDAPDGTMLVARVGSGLVSGTPTNFELAPVMTQTQFDDVLERQRVARMRAEEWQRQMIEVSLAGASSTAVTGSGLTQTALDRALMDPFSLAPTSQKYMGRLAEASYPSQAGNLWGLGMQDTNARTWIDRRGRTHQPTEENFPVMDFERLRGQPATILGLARVSVKASTQATQAGRFNYFRQGLAQMLETSSRRSALPTYIANDPQFAGAQPGQYDANRSTVLRDAFIAINAEDVRPFQQLLRDPAQRETAQSATSLWNDTGGPQQGGPPRQGWRALFEGEMREHPVRIGQTDYATPAALDQAHQAGQVSDTQYQAAQREVGERLARRVVSSGITAPELASLRSRRTSLAGLTDAQLGPLLSPEYMRSQRAGGGLAGEAHAGTGAGLQGGAVGGVIAVVTTAGVMLFDEADHPHWERELGVTGGLGFGGGFVGGATEQIVASRGTQYLIDRAAASTATRLTPGAVTGLSRFGGGGVGAVFVETLSMGVLEDREHTGAEWGVRGTRSFALGGTSAVIGAEAGAGSVVLATAIAGAAGGSIAPGVGTAIGFVVGLAVGGVVYALGDYVVPGGRADWDAYEAGCQPPPRPSSDRLYTGWCFEAGTPVMLADGRELPIGEIAVGDVVLSWHERDDCLQPRPVLAVHVGAPAPMLGVATADGGWFAVTPAHKVRLAEGWLAVADLRPGDRLCRLAGGEVALVEVTGIELLAPGAQVVDLAVETTHTYFAGGVLAHNKNA